MSEQLYCGASRKCITPPAHLMPDLYGLRRQSFGGVLDDIFLRVLALKSREKTFLFVVYDLDKAPYPRKWIDALMQRFDIPEEQIIYCAIHTHCAPITDMRPYEAPNRRWLKTHQQQAATSEYEDFLLNTLIEAVQEAICSMRPAKFGYSCGKSYVNVNRNVDYVSKQGKVCAIGNNFDADADHDLFIGRLETEEGTPIAFLVNYAVHNCIMHQNTMCDGKLAITSDLGGNISQRLEQDYPGVVALWTSGAAGDVNPILMNEVCHPDIEGNGPTSEMLSGDQTLFLRTMVTRHYADVQTVLKEIQCKHSVMELDAQIKWISTPGRRFPEEDQLPEQMRSGDEEPQYCVRLQGVRLGEVMICGVSGELYTSFARQIQTQSPFAKTLVINHNACQMANSQYILDDDGIARNALGYNHSFIRPGYVGAALKEAVGELFEELK